jgi:hypothetical protein
MHSLEQLNNNELDRKVLALDCKQLPFTLNRDLAATSTERSTGTELFIPIHPRLRDATPSGHLTFLPRQRWRR